MPGRRDDQSPEDDEPADGETQKGGSAMTKKTRVLEPFVLEWLRISRGTGGFGEGIFHNVWLTGRFISFANTAKEPIPGLEKASKVV